MHTTAKEQLQNARMLASAGLAVILPESELSYPHLATALKDAKQLTVKSLDLPRDAAKVMVQHLLRDFS